MAIRWEALSTVVWRAAQGLDYNALTEKGPMVCAPQENVL